MMKRTTLYLAVATTLISNSQAFASEHSNHAYNQEKIPEHLRAPYKGVVDKEDSKAVDRDQLSPVSVIQSSIKKPTVNIDASVAPICLTTADLANVNGQRRIDLLETNADFSCFEDNMWAVADDLKATLFDSSSMTAVAQRAQELAAQYDGTNSNGLRNFINYLRVGFWAVTTNRSEDVTTAVEGFLDTLVANPNYYNTNDENAFNVKEAMILMFIENWRSRYINAGIGWLQRYDVNWGANMQRLLTKTLTLFYRGRNDQAFKAAVEQDRALVTALKNFLSNNENLIGHTREYQYNDAANELARLLGIGGQTYQEVKVIVRDFLATHTMMGDHSTAWLNMAGQVDYYDNTNCNYYNTCNYKQTLETAVLPITYNCSSTLRVRAQELTNDQLVGICEDLATQETYFHNKLNTAHTPVADDNNDTLELVIYNSSSEYKKFSGILFNHSTDNGGIYLEGDPAVPGNIPRFMAHEAEWLSDFTVWNLEHEYVHYLDGRFNKKGNFQDGKNHNTVWWSEGLAEYISKKDFNDDAIEEARKSTYNLNDLFKTNYDDHGSTRIYDWGYLAVRYMFEERQTDINALLIELRNGDYVGFDNYLANIGTQYNSNFSSWLQTVESTKDNNDDTGALTNGQSVTVNSDGTELPAYFIDVPVGATNLVIQTSGGTAGDADLHVNFGSEATHTDYDYRPWKSGSNETVSVPSPQAGRWHIMISPYGNQAMANVNLTVSWTESDGGTQVEDACVEKTPISSGSLSSGSAVCLDGSRTSYMSIWVPAGKSSLSFSTGHGSGDLTLYHKAGGWPDVSSYDNTSATAGNSENITINNPSASWHYLMVTEQHSGAALLAVIE
ncbi:M9 family metallopeptidase [Pseudoalteromonas piscicida]